MTLAAFVLAALDDESSASSPSFSRARRVEAAAIRVQGDSDAELVARIRAGDAHAFEQVYRTLWPSLTGFAESITRNANIAEEIVGDVFVTLWQRRERWEPVTMQSYLFGAVRNGALNYRRTMARNAAVLAGWTPGESPGASADIPAPDATLVDRERLRAVQRVLQQLTEAQTTLLMLRWHRGMRWDEIAAVLGTSTTAIQQQHSRLLRAIRASVESFLG